MESVETTHSDPSAAAPEDSASATESTEEAAPQAEEAAPSRSWQDTLSYLQKVDPDAYQHARNMQADYTRKTQTAAARARELDAREQALQETRAQVEALVATFAGTDADELPPYDPFDPQSVVEHARRGFYERHIKPLEAAALQQQAEVDLQRVQRENPDIFEAPEVKAELVAFLKERPHYKLVDGIEVIRARLHSRKQQEASVVEQAVRGAARKSALTATAAPSRHTPRSARPPRREVKKLDNAAILALAKELDGA